MATGDRKCPFCGSYGPCDCAPIPLARFYGPGDEEGWACPYCRQPVIRLRSATTQDFNKWLRTTYGYDAYLTEPPTRAKEQTMEPYQQATVSSCTIRGDAVKRPTVTQHAIEVRGTLRGILDLAHMIRANLDPPEPAVEGKIPLTDCDQLSAVVDTCGDLAARLRSVLQEIADRL